MLTLYIQEADPTVYSIIFITFNSKNSGSSKHMLTLRPSLYYKKKTAFPRHDACLPTQENNKNYVDKTVGLVPCQSFLSINN